MYLNKIQIKNFRKFQNINLEFNKGLNLLIGENDSGKSAIIDAIKFVLGTHSNDWLRLEKEDFYTSDGVNFETEITIAAIFKDLNDDEAAMFLEWLSIDDGKYYLKITLKAKRKEKKSSISEIYYDIIAGENEESGTIIGEARNKLKVTYLKPLRDAEYELAPRKGSRLSQILNNYDIFQKQNDKDEHALEKTMREANDSISAYFLSGEGKVVAETIDSYLGENGFSLQHNQLSSKFGITRQDLGRILEKLELKGLSASGGNLGLGSNNLLFIAAEMLLLKFNNYIGLKLSLIEEIEAHLHPQAQINLMEFLSKQSESLQLQSIITTHSNSLASKVDLENLILCKNGNAFSLRKGETKLSSGDYEFLRRFLDDTKANLFFASGVIIVEGDAENLLLPTFAEFIGYPLHKYGISIVNVGSTAMFRYAKVFLRKNPKEELDIPVAIITDLDVKPREYYEDIDNKSRAPIFYQALEVDINAIKIQFPEIKDTDFTSLITEKYQARIHLEKAFKNLIPKELKVKTKACEVFSKLIVPTEINLDELPTIKHHEYLKKSFNKNKVKYFVGKDWTLEYILGMSCINHLFYEAILTAQLLLKSNDFNETEEEYIEALTEIKSKVSNDMKDWKSASMSESRIAYMLYWEIMQGKDKNKTSKAVVAQCLSKILKTADNTIKERILQDIHLKYLVDAIKHAANVSN